MNTSKKIIKSVTLSVKPGCGIVLPCLKGIWQKEESLETNLII